jgi:hypothetical protein
MEAARRKAESTGYGKIPEIPVKSDGKKLRKGKGEQSL